MRSVPTALTAFPKLLLLAALLAGTWTPDARADKKTVCSITVNSPDEREMFQRSLPRDEFEFVELVERGRPDWLESACRKGVRCDMLIISGHFDDGTQFYSDRLDAREFLAVEEMERVSCSESCPGLFSQLKEVYLFGCNTLNAEALRSASGEIARSLIRSGHSKADADRLSRLLAERHGDSNLDRMRQIFKDVPVIYGFSGKAPLGPTAASVLQRYFQLDASEEVGSGHASRKLLNLFAPVSMTSAAGLTESDPQANYRRDVCQFSDDRLSPAGKLRFVHEVLGREMAEVRMFLHLLTKYTGALTVTDRFTPAVAQELDEIARDHNARERFLAFARDADEPAVRVKMLDLARFLDWLSPAEHRAEVMSMIREQLAGDSVGVPEVDLACALNKEGELGQELDRLSLPPTQAAKATHAAVLACLGSADGRARVLRALTSPRIDDVAIAEVYLHHRPITDVQELRTVATGIAKMNNAEAQVRALDALARGQVADRQSLDALTRLFPLTKSVNVQRSIAGILVRADYAANAKPELVRALRQHRLKSPDGEDVIDILLRRLEAPRSG
ncbi:MAG: hypothetical protein ABJC33_10510 [Betaproteobacteria bacterium]